MILIFDWTQSFVSHLIRPRRNHFQSYTWEDLTLDPCGHGVDGIIMGGPQAAPAVQVHKLEGPGQVQVLGCIQTVLLLG
jgi:hypothetical protein